MKIVHHQKPYYTIIYDFYTDQEQNEIWEEIEQLKQHDVLSENPADTAGAWVNDMFVTQRYIKRNLGKFLDGYYKDERDKSAILKYIQRINSTKNEYNANYFKEMHDGENPFTPYLFHTNYYTTLLNYYEDTHHYEPHHDHACLTVISYFWKHPKKFTGGELSFTQYPPESVPLENNCVIIFPSFQRHAVSPVVMDKNDSGELNGRVAISQFLSHKFVPSRRVG